jgi:hypothetical protein
MSIKTIIIGAAAAGIALGSFGLAAGDASAAVIIKKPGHHTALVCKAGFNRHQVKVHGKRVWECVKVRVPHHKPIIKKL